MSCRFVASTTDRYLSLPAVWMLASARLNASHTSLVGGGEVRIVGKGTFKSELTVDICRLSEVGTHTHWKPMAGLYASPQKLV